MRGGRPRLPVRTRSLKARVIPPHIAAQTGHTDQERRAARAGADAQSQRTRSATCHAAH